jgi:hypothetical protein
MVFNPIATRAIPPHAGLQLLCCAREDELLSQPLLNGYLALFVDLDLHLKWTCLAS